MARTPSPARETRALSQNCASALPEALRCFDHVLRVDTAFFHHTGAGCAQAELVQPDDFSVETDIFVPNLRHASFDGDAFAARVRQNVFAVFRWLAIKSFKARHGNDADAVAPLF